VSWFDPLHAFLALLHFVLAYSDNHVIMFANNRHFDMVEDVGGEFNGRQVEQIFDVIICTIHGTSAASTSI
jgi:hypothetical protein